MTVVSSSDGEGLQPSIVDQVEGPCDPVDGPADRARMYRTSRRQTGVDGLAAYDAITNRRLAQNQPLWWVTCEPGRNGELPRRSDGHPVVDYPVAVLLPRATLGSFHQGDLVIRARRLGDPDSILSDPLILRLVEKPQH